MATTPDRPPLDYVAPRSASLDEYEASLRGEDLPRPTRHIRIGSSIPWWEIAVCWIVAAAIGAMLAIGGAF